MRGAQRRALRRVGVPPARGRRRRRNVRAASRPRQRGGRSTWARDRGDLCRPLRRARSGAPARSGADPDIGRPHDAARGVSKPTDRKGVAMNCKRITKLAGTSVLLLASLPSVAGAAPVRDAATTSSGGFGWLDLAVAVAVLAGIALFG